MDFTHIAGRPETFEAPPDYDVIAPMMELPEADGEYEAIPGRPETWPPGSFAADPNRMTEVLTSLSPASAVLGSPDFTLHVMGNAFSPDSVIVFAGQDEPTTFVSPSELTTGVDMSVWNGVDPAIPVFVRGANGLESNTLTFAFTEA